MRLLLLLLGLLRPLVFSKAVFVTLLFLGGGLKAASEITPGLAKSSDYRVWVDGRELIVYESRKTGTHGTSGITRMSFAGFDLVPGATSKVRIQGARDLSAATIRPKADAPVLKQSEEAGAPPKNPVYEFEIDRARHVVILPDATWENVLVLSANPPHTPPDPAKTTYYFEAGVHRIGAGFSLKSGDEVYLAEGAILEGGFKLEKVENVKIYGRGILALGRWPHQENFRVIAGDKTKNILIDGITITNAPGWVISFWNGSDELHVNNVKLVGNWFYNTDGVQTGTRGLRVENSFMQCNDDNFSLNGICRDVVIENNVLWNIYNGGVFMLGWGCQDLGHIRVQKNTIIRAGGCCAHHPKGPFSMKFTNKGGRVDDVLFKDIVVEEVARVSNWINFQMEAEGVVKKIRFENIELHGLWRRLGDLRGYSEISPIEGVRFESVSIDGKPAGDVTELGLQTRNTAGLEVVARPSTEAAAAAP